MMELRTSLVGNRNAVSAPLSRSGRELLAGERNVEREHGEREVLLAHERQKLRLSRVEVAHERAALAMSGRGNEMKGRSLGMTTPSWAMNERNCEMEGRSSATHACCQVTMLRAVGSDRSGDANQRHDAR